MGNNSISEPIKIEEGAAWWEEYCKNMFVSEGNSVSRDMACETQTLGNYPWSAMNRCIQGVNLRRPGRLGATVVMGEEVIGHLKDRSIDPYQWVV